MKLLVLIFLASCAVLPEPGRSYKCHARYECKGDDTSHTDDRDVCAQSDDEAYLETRSGLGCSWRFAVVVCATTEEFCVSVAQASS